MLTDTQDSSPQPSEEMLSSQSELRSSKCPQDRELPSIPPNSTLEGMGSSSGPLLPPSGDGTYEVLGIVVVDVIMYLFYLCLYGCTVWTQED